MLVVTAKSGGINLKGAMQQLRKAFALPEKAQEEQTFDYITGIRPDAEIEYLTIAGMNFEKRVMPNAASYITEQEKYHEPRIIARPLTEKQAKAIMERAEEIEIEIPVRQNLAYNGKNDEGEYLPAKTIKASDVIILCKASEYNPISIQSTQREDLLKKEEKVENVREEMYKAQKNVDYKVKK